MAGAAVLTSNKWIVSMQTALFNKSLVWTASATAAREVMLQAGQSKAIDMFLNFPVMDMNRNAIWHNPDKAPQGGINRMNRFWGDDSWTQAAYAESKQTNLFGKPSLEKQDNAAIVKAFQKRLQDVAGFESVPDPLPMRNSNNAVVYYLFFASQKPVAKKIITDIFKKYRPEPSCGHCHSL
jgi:three-Cys-motif partner protein